MLQRSIMMGSRVRAMQMVGVGCAVALIALALVGSYAAAEAPGNQYFQRTWERTDKPVAELRVRRTWMWGPEAFTGLRQELYAEAPGGLRTVQYFDKSRMEIATDPDVDPNSIWYVTNGLLAKELITGQLQLGDDLFEPHLPAQINVAGDPNDPDAPTYAALAELLDDAPHPTGAAITRFIDRDGTVATSDLLAAEDVTAARYVEQTDHTVASVFWEFMNSEGLVYENGQYVTDELFVDPFYATGFPITEAYWTTVLVNREPTRVLLQCFERRCLTYTPDNPAGWQVEAGNVGQHYYQWRYELIPAEATPTPTATPTATPTNTPTPTETPITGTTGNLLIEHINEPIQGGSLANVRVVIRNMALYDPVELEGWQLRDEAGHVYVFPDVTLLAGFYVEVRNCAGEDRIARNYAVLYWGECVNFPQGTVYLIDSLGNVVDTYG